jgi:threonine-phosphate decarboxylase
MEVAGFELRAEEDFQPDFPGLGKMLQGNELVFICNPNNPTSRVTASAEILDFISRHKKTSFLVDESYLPFVRETSLLELPIPDNLFILFSASKIYGIPGLRLGFLVSTAANLTLLSGRSKPWGVNRLAQVAGEYLLKNADGYVDAVVNFVERERPAFAAELSELPGVKVVPGRANFVLCRLTGTMTAPCLREKMLEHRIIIRDCSNFAALDDRYFRLSLKEKEQNRRCLTALREILGGNQ